MKRSLALGAALALVLAPVAEAACYTPAEWEAAEMRMLQSDLMVAALGCGDRDGSFAAGYNSFVGKHKTSLVSHSQVLQRYYQRIYGSAGTKQFDQFVTQVSNDASERSLQAGAGYCDQARVLLTTVNRIETRELPVFAAARVDGFGVVGDICGGAKVATAAPTARGKAVRK